MDHATEVVFGYSPSKGQYHVDEIRGSSPVTTYQCNTGIPDVSIQLNDPDFVQMETITVHVGDWLLETEANALGARTHLTVRLYRQETK